ncbi:MAG: glycosyltransferase [Cytophagaceae bacterium]|jgi:glycosyltransferase involved in cell wall biosynthesis|nr:glycosyltransferase [Cytophagaceae bacterium]
MDGQKLKNILILCDAFPPAFNPRMGYLCKYLPEHGWNPIIVTEYVPENIFSNLSTVQNIKYINFYWKKNGKISRLKYVTMFFAELLLDYKNRRLRKEAEMVIGSNDISFILASVSFRAFPALAASWVGKAHRIPYIVDCRDIYEQFPNREYSSKVMFKSAWINRAVDVVLQKKYKSRRNKILRSASTVTTVSEWHRQELKKYNANAHLIYNGFDGDAFYFKPVVSRMFKITYVGRIESEAVKDPSLLFESVAFLANKNMITPDTFRVQFYLLNQSSKTIINKMIEKYRLEKYIDVFGDVENEKVPDILNESSILLLLANRTTEQQSPKGIMGTKVYEYLAVEKPVLCVRNDESCLEETIKATCSGISASTVEQVNTFITDQYTEWQKNGFTHQRTCRAAIEKFSRRYQARQFAGLIESSGGCAV